MKSLFTLIVAGLFLLGWVLPTQAHAESPDWVKGLFGQNGAPFSFVLDGKPSAVIMPKWSDAKKTAKEDVAGVPRTITYTTEVSGLEVRCEVTEYSDFPAVAWTICFANRGKADTAILEDVQALNTVLPVEASSSEVHYALGSHERPDDFAPRRQGLEQPLRVAPFGGRSSDGVLPFFNVQGKGGGAMLAVGWTGQWAASFEKDSGGQVRVKAGMERTHLRLHPGEEIRTPMILVLGWEGADRMDGQNALRRLLLAHFTPQPGGRPVEPPIAASPHGAIGFVDTTEANMIEGINNIAAHKFPVDTWWIDAGWHGTNKEWARNVGTWEANPAHFPNGLKPVADAAHKNGLKFLLWCEPERVMPNTWLFDNHPEWILSPAGLPADFMYQENDRFRLLNFGNPEALAWAKEKFSTLIREVGIDIYRQDFNMTPLFFWRNGEAEDRQGMNEIRYITGLYDFYDTLSREHPGLLIDTCASGGRRIDIEILRRSLILFRSDFCWDAVSEQGMAYGLSLWTPITGVGAIKTDPYNFRSGMGSHVSLALDYYHESEIWKQGAEEIEKCKAIRHLFTADFYPLTEYSLEKNQWMAWQYHDPKTGEGVVEAFRRDTCPAESLTVLLRGLKANASYSITNIDTGETSIVSGDELQKSGMKIGASEAPAARLIRYKEQGESGTSNTTK